MSQIKRKPVNSSSRDSLARPLRASRESVQEEVYSHVPRGMPHELHAMDHPALQATCMCQSRNLTARMDESVHRHFSGHMHDSDDIDIGMAPPRSYSPLDENPMAFTNMNPTSPYVNPAWVPQQLYSYREASPQLPMREVSPIPPRSDNSTPIHIPQRDIEAISSVSTPTLITPAPPPPPSPPNGGTTAWLQVVGAFLLFFNSW